MRYLSIALVIGLCIVAPAWAQDEDVETAAVVDEQSAEPSSEPSQKQESVTFDGETLNLAWQGNDPGETVKEFIPAGQDLASWTKLASIREYAELDDVPALIDSFVQVLKERYPRSSVKVFENDKTGAAMLEFTVWPGEGEMQDAPFVEYNIFKYEKAAEGGVVAQQYALREYRRIDDFLRRLEPIKKRLLEEMSSEGLQAVDADQTADDETRSDDESDK